MATQPSWYQDPRSKMRERSVGVMALIAILCFVAVAGTIFAYYFLPNPDLLLSRDEAEARNKKLRARQHAGHRIADSQQSVGADQT